MTPLLALGLSAPRARAQQPADSLGPASVYVPASCAGTPARRCPLVVFPQVPAPVARSAGTARTLLEWQRALADKYGAILLVSDSAALLAADDTLVPQALSAYAIDPAKVAVIGYRVALKQGCPDPTVFSRIVLLSPAFGDYHEELLCEAADRAPPPGAVQVYLEGGLGDVGFLPQVMLRVPPLRQQGQALELALTVRGYDVGLEEVERAWRWLSESWATPAGQPASNAPVVATPPDGVDRAAADADDAGPLLTAQALDQLTRFWHRFLQEPDSIRTAARRAHQRRITVPVQPTQIQDSVPRPTRIEPFTVWVMDTPALAAQYPSVQAALQAAGLTAQEADAYRRALIAAAANRPAGYLQPPLAPAAADSRLGQNVAFMAAHVEALKALGATGMWTTP